MAKAAQSNCPILVLNCGSSSIKSALFDAVGASLPRAPLWKGKVEGISGSQPTFSETNVEAAPLTFDSRDPYGGALDHIRARAGEVLRDRGPAAVAHRVVHGGSKYYQPIRVDGAVLADLRSYIPLAPLHQPFALDVIASLQEADPDLPQVACFDTAFHQTMAPVELVLALPYAAHERGLRRHGFHGLSYEYMATALPERHGERARGRVIVAHLGSGASLCAMRDLKSVTTTMGFSALDGLMMGTRCGSLDPGALIYLMEIEKLSLERIAQILYRESGLLGVSGVSSDPRELLPREAGDERVALALALYVRRIVREVGALTAVLGGLDLLVFTAGIGEHNAVIRRRVCRDLDFLGVALDDARNDAHAALISTASSKVAVAVEPTNEEWIVASHGLAVLRKAGRIA
jgi:acetate kinase